MQWFNKTAQPTNPFAFNPAPKSTAPKSQISWGNKPSAPGPATEGMVEDFERTDPMTRVTRFLRGLSPQELGALADMMEGPTFKASLSPAAKTQEAPQAMPPQDVPQPAPQAPQQKALTPRPTPQRGTPEAWDQHLTNLDRQRRLREGRPPGMQGM